MRSISRVLGISINTVTKLLVEAGLACQEFHDLSVWGVQAQYIECDEIWSFCYSNERNAGCARGVIDAAGDVWTWTAMDRGTKLLISWLVGDRDAVAVQIFMDDLQSRLANRVQLTTDGLTAYSTAVDSAFGGDVDYGTIVKLYGGLGRTKQPEVQLERRYSPAGVSFISKHKVSGNPDMDEASTSRIERHNLTIRMSVRRFTRLTNAFSKKLENHCHSLALFFAWYNFCRPHKSLSKPYATTPAMAAGLTTSLHDMEWLLEIIDDRTEVRKSSRSN